VTVTSSFLINCIASFSIEVLTFDIQVPQSLHPGYLESRLRRLLLKAICGQSPLQENN
jgi:hypothetical protein